MMLEGTLIEITLTKMYNFLTSKTKPEREGGKQTNNMGWKYGRSVDLVELPLILLPRF